MGFDFTKVPTSNPYALVPKGFYKFTITNSEMKQPKDALKPQYLNLTFALTNALGKGVGSIFEIITESTNPAVLYKIGRLTNAVGLDMSTQQNVELRDLAKVLQNRTGVLEVEHYTPKDTPNAQPKAQVRMFGSECFWPMSEYDRLVAGAAPVYAETDGAPMPWDDLIPASDPIPPTAGPSNY